MPLEVLYLFPIIVLAYTTQAMIGFGAPLIAVTLGANLIPIELLVPSLVPLSVIAPGIIAFQHRKKIQLDLLFKQILPFMGGGLIVGLVIYPHLKAFDLKRVLGAMVVVVSARALISMVRGGDSTASLPKWASRCLQILAGVIQAVYITGGPLLVYSISRLEFGKGVFRATLCTVWVGMNGLLVGIFICTGRVNYDSIRITVILFAAIPLGIMLGSLAHNRLDPQRFQMVIYFMLLGAGIKLIVV